MSVINWRSSLIMSGGAIVISGLILKYLKNMKVEDLFKTDSAANTLVNDVLLYGRNSFPSEEKDHSESNLRCILEHISQTEKCIDVCMSKLTSPDLGKQLIMLQQRKDVRVRIISYGYESKDKLTQITSLLREGTQVRVLYPPNKLLHEFILVDAMDTLENKSKHNGVLMVGGLDYSYTLKNNNYDSTIITSLPSVVDEFRVEFERLWNSNQCTYATQEEFERVSNNELNMNHTMEINNETDNNNGTCVNDEKSMNTEVFISHEKGIYQQ